MKLAKSPGHDWAVVYRWETGTEDKMLVFGVLTPEKALEEAHYSLGRNHDLLYDILEVRRL